VALLFHMGLFFTKNALTFDTVELCDTWGVLLFKSSLAFIICMWYQISKHSRLSFVIVKLKHCLLLDVAMLILVK